MSPGATPRSSAAFSDTTIPFFGPRSPSSVGVQILLVKSTTWTIESMAAPWPTSVAGTANCGSDAATAGVSRIARSGAESSA